LFCALQSGIRLREKAELKSIRAAYETLPTAMKDDVKITFERVFYAMCARDFAAAEVIVSKSPNAELSFYGPLASTPNRHALA
jgi:hypothetical protein